jgi:hypothetical protein
MGNGPLPFFSRLNLVNAFERLTRLEYKASLLRIEERSENKGRVMPP